MTSRRVFVGVLVLSAFTVLCWARPGARQAHAGQVAATGFEAADMAKCSGDGNQDSQEYRFRTNQPRHWKHIMLGTR